MTKEAPWMNIAISYLGQREIAGKKHNPVIIKFFAESGHPEIDEDEVHWCSAFANAVMFEWGTEGTNSLLARSWLKWKNGDVVSIPRYGDIAIFQRGSDPTFGHVAFFEKWDDNYVYVLGGNQSNGVTRTKIARSKLLGFRRPKVKTVAFTEKAPVKVETPDIMVGTGGVVAATKPLMDGDWVTGLIILLFFGGIVGYTLWKRHTS